LVISFPSLLMDTSVPPLALFPSSMACGVSISKRNFFSFSHFLEMCLLQATTLFSFYHEIF
jgi:hypothetical protein